VSKLSLLENDYIAMSKFFRILADPDMPTRWYLKAPHNEDGTILDARLFIKGVPYSKYETLVVPLRRQGQYVDFNFGDFDMVIMQTNLNSKICSQFALNVQRIPVKIEEIKNDFEILNVLDLVACVDEENSEFDKWPESDGRYDKIGKFRMFTRLCIDEKIAQGHHLFRLVEWPLALIASSELKEFLEKLNVTGIIFVPINMETKTVKVIH
jgi:hypothetical protein